MHKTNQQLLKPVNGKTLLVMLQLQQQEVQPLLTKTYRKSYYSEISLPIKSSSELSIHSGSQRLYTNLHFGILPVVFQ